MIFCMVEGCENKTSAIYVAVFRMPYFNEDRKDKFELELDDVPLCAEHCALVRPLIDMDMDEWEYLVNKSLHLCEDIPDRSKAKMIFKQVRPSYYGR